MSLEKAINRLTQVIKAVKVGPNTTPIEYGPDGRMRPAGIAGTCSTRHTPEGYQCMCYYDKADGTRCVVSLNNGLCGKKEGPVNIPVDMPCMTS